MNLQQSMVRAFLAVALSLAWSIAVVADVLVLRDGTRIQGSLLSVRNGVVEFQERRGFGGGRTVRVNRDEVTRIELDDNRFDDDFGGGRPGSGMR